MDCPIKTATQNVDEIGFVERRLIDGWANTMWVRERELRIKNRSRWTFLSFALLIHLNPQFYSIAVTWQLWAGNNTFFMQSPFLSPRRTRPIPLSLSQHLKRMRMDLTTHVYREVDWTTRNVFENSAVHSSRWMQYTSTMLTFCPDFNRFRHRERAESICTNLNWYTNQTHWAEDEVCLQRAIQIQLGAIKLGIEQI